MSGPIAAVVALQGMRVIGAVEDAEGDAVTIETGHRVKTTVNRADVSISTLFTTTTAGRSAPRRCTSFLSRPRFGTVNWGGSAQR